MNPSDKDGTRIQVKFSICFNSFLADEYRPWRFQSLSWPKDMTPSVSRIRLMIFFWGFLWWLQHICRFFCWHRAIEYSLCKAVSEYLAQCTVCFGLQEGCKVHVNISSISYLYLIFYIWIISHSLLSTYTKKFQFDLKNHNRFSYFGSASDIWRC